MTFAATVLMVIWILIGYLSVRNWEVSWFWKLASPLYSLIFALLIIFMHDIRGQVAVLEAIFGCIGLNFLMLMTGYAMKKDEEQYD